MIKNLIFILNISRWYALPMSFFSWLVVFCYSLYRGGSWMYGIIALLGICTSHLATNLFDDYVDYHKLSKETVNNKIILKNTQFEKCRYIIEGKLTLRDVSKLIAFYLLISLIIAIFFLFTVGKGVLIFVLAALLIIFLYPFMSNIRLSELAVGLIYGPILFGGTYYVMFGHLDWKIFILAIPSMIFTINLVFTDNILDKNIDNKEGKKTLVGLIKSDNSVLIFHIILLFVGYISIPLLVIFNITNPMILFVFLTLPFAFDLIYSMRLYIKDSTSCPQKYWFHFPMENITEIRNNGSYPYMFRMYQARNLMIYIAIILAITMNF